MNENPKDEDVLCNSESNFENESTSIDIESDKIPILNNVSESNIDDVVILSGESNTNLINDNPGFENIESPIINSNSVNNENDLHSASSQRLLSSEISKKKAYIIVISLVFINLLNYIDRFTITGLLPDLKSYYNVNDEETGLLQTFFVISYMISCPIFGYIGDRYNRKYLICCGMLFWLTATLCSSFVPRNMFRLFIVFRSLIGVGEASFSTTAPTIISDLFTSDLRIKLIALFSVAIPVGCGCGFMLGFAMKSLFHQWQAALRCTPIIGLFCLICLLIFVKEPQRGFAEGAKNLEPASWRVDIYSLIRNPSFMLISFGFTLVCFIIGSLSWFFVLYMQYAIHANPQPHLKLNEDNIVYIFGGLTVVSGLLGIIIGIETSRRLKKFYANVDAIICGFGLILAAPCILTSLALAKYYLHFGLFIIVICQISLSLNWALITDMTMSITMPCRRSSAVAFQMMLGHILGDAISPFLIGILKKFIATRFNEFMDSYNIDYYSMQYALLMNAFIAVIGGLFFLLASLYIVTDKSKVLREIEEINRQNEITISSSGDSID